MLVKLALAIPFGANVHTGSHDCGEMIVCLLDVLSIWMNPIWDSDMSKLVGGV